MLIRNASRLDGTPFDLRIAQGRIVAMDRALAPEAGEPVIDAAGGALLPGLNDHHLHLMAAAAALQSVRCGPPEVNDPEALAAALHAAAQPGRWLRGVAWHESVMADVAPLDRDWLDRHGPTVPIRIQHRSGRLWVLNSLALDAIGPLDDTAPLQRHHGRLTGHLLDGDLWLRQRLPGTRPSLAPLSQRLAAFGVTGVTDATPANNLDAAEGYRDAQQRGELRQSLRLMGNASLDALVDHSGLTRGEGKFHLHEHALPDFDVLVGQIRARHAAGRAAAFHCVSRIELVYALEALRAAGTLAGDRIEHGGICAPEAVEALQALRLTVVSQPHFIAEKGDRYRLEVEAHDQPWLYRLQGLQAAGIPVAAGTDAPFGGLNPWASMQAAVDRRCRDGSVMGAMEALTPEAALGLYTGTPDAPGIPRYELAPGQAADLCLIDRPWQVVRHQLAAVKVVNTWRAGALISG